MKMLTKFESKSSRAKGVAFHPRRPWVLVGLHSSTIQLWDYRMGTLIDRFEDHEAPVRSLDFHPTQPLFASGSDDCTIKVWSTVTRKCIFTLMGHLDYLRAVSFHHELPWIVSCSDDQTIRIWNWQNRQEIACLTGHNHYVYSVQFHPTEDLLVSASLDQTVRVWDISSLRQKHSAPTSSAKSFEEQLLRQQLPQQDIFGNVNAVVKYVLEGHDKGVNWASFHPTLPLIASAGDDRVVKLWRMSDSKAWEVDTCRGHTGNVLCCIFHPHEDLILSVSDDKTIRVFDLNKRTPVKQFKREEDRFWQVRSHPNINLFAACHDSGVMVFKLERERPASFLFQNKLFYVNGEKQVQCYDYQKKEVSLPMLSLKKIGKPWSFIRTLSYNHTDNSILVTHADSESSSYSLIALPKHVTGAIEPTNVRQGEGNFASFINRNRFVTFSKASKTLQVKDLNNNVTKSSQLDSSVNEVLPGSPGRVLLVKSNSVISYDVQQRKEVSEISANNVKYVTWSNDGRYLALLSKHTITIANKDLELITSLHETIRIKSAAWDDSGVLLYSTLNHIKYTLLNGDNGIMKTLENTLYITKIASTQVFCLNRAGEVEIVTIDPTDFRFKRALVNKNFAEVLRIIKTSNLVGQNIIAYLQKKGYPEVALQFVQDPETRFELALECGNLEVALKEAKTLNNNGIWEKLGEEALNQGNIGIVELVYQQLHLFDKLSFIYLCRGETGKLNKMSIIAENRGDYSSLIQNTIYNGDLEKRCQVYLLAGMAPLAYTLAKSSGLDDLAEQILTDNSVNAKDIELPELGNLSEPLQPVENPVSNWPLKDSSLSFFEKALLTGQVADLSLEEKSEVNEKDFSAATSGAEYTEEYDDEEEANGAWNMGDEEDLEIDNEIKDVEEDATTAFPVGSGNESELTYWLRNAKTAAVYVAAGYFDQAASMLHKQLGVVEFEPLRSRFLQVYLASKALFPAMEGLPPFTTFIRADSDEDDPNKYSPFIPGYSTLEDSLSAAFKHFRSNNLEEAIKTFREIIYTIAVLNVYSEEEETKCLDILAVCREYILGLLMELSRRKLDASNVKRNLELAAYFTRTKLQNPHKLNALQVAMTQSFKHKNFASASYFAEQFLAISSSGPRSEQAHKLKAKADLNPSDAVEIDFDPDAEFDICAATFSPIYSGSPCVSEALVGAKYKPEYKGSLCNITKITGIGAQASGIRIKVSN